MKAAVVKGRRLIACEEVPIPSAQPGTLLLKTKYCCTCGSELEYVDNQRAPENPVTAGDILGHEFVAEVAEVGEGVKGWSVGDRVVPGFRRPCGQCYWCQRGLHHLCVGGPSRYIPGGVGSHGPSRNGAMAEYFVRPPTGLLKVPDGVSDEEAGVSQPLGVGTWVVHCAGIKMGDSVAIIGAGHIGLLTMVCARADGAAPIIVTDVIKPRLNIALEMGADKALNPNEVDVVSEVEKLTEVGVDVAFVCVRRGGDVLKQAFDMVRVQGRVILAGYTESAELNATSWLRKQVRIEGSLNRGAKMATALRLLEYKRVNVKPVITEIIPLEETQRAFDSMYSGENIAVLLKP